MMFHTGGAGNTLTTNWQRGADICMTVEAGDPAMFALMDGTPPNQNQGGEIYTQNIRHAIISIGLLTGSIPCELSYGEKCIRYSFVSHKFSMECQAE